MSLKALAVVAALLVTGGAVVLLVDRDEPSFEEAAQGEPAPRRARDGHEARHRRDDGPHRSSNGAAAPRFEPGRGSLDDRVAALEREVVALRRALAVRGKVEIASAGAPDSIVDDPVLEQEVRGIVEQERELEREREMERRRDRIEEFRAEALDELVRVASLGEEQRTALDELWSSEADRLLPLMTAVRAGDKSFGEAREEARTIRQQTDDAARELLSDSQFESYEELRPRGPGGRGPSRGPSGPPR